MPYTYVAKNEWWGDNETRSDELWNGVNTDRVCISPTDTDAREEGLAISGRFPWDNDRGLYFIKGIHDMHCLKLMRNLTKSLVRGEHSYVEWDHYEHCLNALRQDLLCRADDTPMPAVPGMHIGGNQQLMCRDWNKLVEWSQAPGQNACYRQIGDYRSAIIGIERHLFVPKTLRIAIFQRPTLRRPVIEIFGLESCSELERRLAAFFSVDPLRVSIYNGRQAWADIAAREMISYGLDTFMLQVTVKAMEWIQDTIYDTLEVHHILTKDILL